MSDLTREFDLQQMLALARLARDECSEMLKERNAELAVTRQALTDLLDTMERGDEYLAVERMAAARVVLGEDTTE